MIRGVMFRSDQSMRYTACVFLLSWANEKFPFLNPGLPGSKMGIDLTCSPITPMLSRATPCTSGKWIWSNSWQATRSAPGMGILWLSWLGSTSNLRESNPSSTAMAQELLVNRELMKAGYPPVDIKFTDRLAYYNAFDECHVKHNLSAMERLFAGYINMELGMYLAMLQD